MQFEIIVIIGLINPPEAVLVNFYLEYYRFEEFESNYFCFINCGLLHFMYLNIYILYTYSENLVISRYAITMSDKKPARLQKGIKIYVIA